MPADVCFAQRWWFAPVTVVAIAGLCTGAAGQTCPPWEVVDTPDPAGAETAILRDIVAVSPTEVWAVGDYWDGMRIVQFSMRGDGAGEWTFHDIPLRSTLGHGHLWAVDARGGELWAAGDQQHADSQGFWGTHPLAVRHDGSRWEHVDVPSLGLGGSGERLLGIEVLAPDNIWFVGEGFPTPRPQPSLAMRWNGSSFEHIPTPRVNTFTGPSSFGTGDGLRAISALGPDDIWAVGAAGDGDPILTDSQILHWDGEGWEHRPGPVVGVWHSLDAVVAIAPDDVWAGGEYFDGSAYHGLAMHWDGAGWTQVPIAGTVFDFHAFASDDVLAVGAGIMRWDGERWTVVETFPTAPGAALAGISAAPGGRCEAWAAGRDLIGDDLSTLVVHRPEGGCRADVTGDGVLDFFDLLAFQDLFAAGDLRADFTGDGVLDFFDFLAFQEEFAGGCA